MNVHISYIQREKRGAAPWMEEVECTDCYHAVRLRYKGLCNDQCNLLARVPWARVLGFLTDVRQKVTGGHESQQQPHHILVVRLALVEILMNGSTINVDMFKWRATNSFSSFRSDHKKPGVQGRAVFAGRVPCLSTRDELAARSLGFDPIGLAHCNEEGY